MDHQQSCLVGYIDFDVATNSAGLLILSIGVSAVFPMHFTTLSGFGHLERESPTGSPCAGSTQTAGAPLPNLQSVMGQLSRTLPWHCGPASAAEEGASATGEGIGGLREPKTGALFPPRFCQRGDTHCGTLQGIG